jgi:hypothetical protein
VRNRLVLAGTLTVIALVLFGAWQSDSTTPAPVSAAVAAGKH